MTFNKVNIISHIIIWTSFFFMTLIYLKGWLDAYGHSFSYWEIAEYTVLYQATLMSVPIFNQAYLVKKFYFKKKYWEYAIILIVLLVFTGFVFMWIDDIYLDKEEFPWMYSFAHWASRMPFQIMFVFVGNWFELSRELQRRKNLEIKQQKEQAEAELKWLISQINPHFLFNALNNINSLIHLERKQASATLVQLSDLLKYVIREGSQARVPIEKEAEHIKNYYSIAIMKKRWKDKIHLDINLQNPYLQVPPLLFINFVENSIKHCNLDEDDAFIRLSLYANAQKIEFALQNTFNLNLSKDKTKGIGIDNVKSRLAILFPDQHKLEIRSNNTIHQVKLELNIHEQQIQE